MSPSIQALDVRVSRAPKYDKRFKAARSAANFIRRQVSATNPIDKEELCKGIWVMYWKLHKSELLTHPGLTRHLLRLKYGYWNLLGVRARWQ